MSDEVRRKHEILVAGRAPRVLDLFSGCGGLSLGFVTAGYVSVGGVEIDADAAQSHAMNFHPGSVDVHGVGYRLGTAGLGPSQKAPLSDGVSPQQLLKDLRKDKSIAELIGDADDLAIDVIVGGPPCPAFTRVGRAKFAKILGDRASYLQDPRARLWFSYMDYVQYFRPVAVILENVPDIMRYGDTNVGEEIAEALDALGYESRYSILNAAAYGVPQLRDRFVLVAVHRRAGAHPAFPRPTHALKMPSGYHHARLVARKYATAQLAFMEGRAGTRIVEPHDLGDGQVHMVTAAAAIGDLPSFTGESRGKGVPVNPGEGAPSPYPGPPQNAYQRLMREWPGLPVSMSVRDHVTRRLTLRDFRLFGLMPQGAEYPKAIDIAEQALKAFVGNLGDGDLSEREWQMLEAEHRSDYVPPYPVSKFPNRWWKLMSDAPSRTLMAHLGKDTYSHIHYDSEQARTITVREAARLQSFPDSFVFAGSMNAKFRQIGNAVPPLLAYHLALELGRRCGWPAVRDLIAEAVSEWNVAPADEDRYISAAMPG